MHSFGPGNETATFQVKNSGDGALTFSATSGTVYTQTSVIVTINASGYTTGTHPLGNITVTNSVAGSPASISVALYVGEVYRSFQPVALKQSGP